MEISNSRSQIQYTLFTEADDIKFNDFFETTFKILRLVPKDILQLSNPERFYDFYQGYRAASGLLFFTINPQWMETVEGPDRRQALARYFSIFSSSIINVFLVDGSIGNHQFVSDFIKQTPFSYVFFIGELSQNDLELYNGCKMPDGVHEFIKDLVGRVDDIGSS